MITVPLERQINGTPGLLLMRSSSTFGLSLITVLFRDGYEDYWVRQRLLERINRATASRGRALARPRRRSRRRAFPVHPGVGLAQSAGVVGDSNRWVVIPAIEVQFPDVVDDATFGGFTTSTSSTLDPKQLDALRAPALQTIINAINSQQCRTSPSGGPGLLRGDQSYVIRERRPDPRHWRNPARSW